MSTRDRSVNDSTKHETSLAQLHYLALGDSYTIGQSVEAQQSFPFQLKDQLTTDGHDTAMPTIIARTGWTTDELIDAINSSGISGQTYDIVTLLIGVNDQYDGLSQDNYRVKFEQVLKTAVGFAGNKKNHVFVVSIPDYGVTPFANGRDAEIAPQIDAFNAINKEISLKYGVHYIDITPGSRKAANDLLLVAEDGLHPSGKMYREWVGLLKPVVEGELKR